MAKAMLARKPAGKPQTLDAQTQAEYLAAAEIIREFWAGRSEKTRRAYEADLKNLQTHLGVPSPGEALAAILRAGPGGAFRIVNGYKASLVEADLASATVNRRLSALRSLVKFARASGLVNWTLEVENVKAERRRDTRGPGSAGVQALLVEVDRGNGGKAVRDRALLRVLYDLGLRRSEASRLDVADVDLDGEAIQVTGKGRREKERLSLPKPTAEALRPWLAVRGDSDGPLFTSFDRSGPGGRLTPGGIYYLIKRYAERAGVRATPHGLRHAAGTTVAERTGDVFAVAAFLRHKDLSTARVYVDNLEDKAGEAARIVAASVE